MRLEYLYKGAYNIYLDRLGGGLIWTIIHCGVLRLLQRAVVSVILKLLWELSYVEDIAFIEGRERECVCGIL